MFDNYVAKSAGLVIAGTLFVTACGGDQENVNGQEDNGDELVSVDLITDWDWLPYHAGIVMALEEGYYEEEGVDLNIDQGQGSATAATLLTQDYDLAHLNTVNAAQAVSEGLPITVVSVHQPDTAASFVGLADNVDLDGPESLIGPTIGSTPGGSDAMSLEVFQAMAGIPEDDLNIVGLQATAKNAALLAGEVDVVSGDLPAYRSLVQAEGEEPSSFALSDMDAPLLGFGISANNDFLEGNEETVRSFIEATRRGFELAESDPEAACDFMIEEYELAGDYDRCVEYAIGQAELQHDPEDEDWGIIDENSFEEMISLLSELELLDQELEAREFYRNILAE